MGTYSVSAVRVSLGLYDLVKFIAHILYDYIKVLKNSMMTQKDFFPLQQQMGPGY